MVQASPSEIEPYIQRIGLYRNKARSIVHLSIELENRFDGVVPSSHKDLESLPGVGRKTANVVRAVAFGIPSFAVDTHVERVSKRLGRYMCTARNPKCDNCPFVSICKKDRYK